MADSKKKDDRRKQWDKVIGEARATVEATDIQQQNRLAVLSDDARKEAWKEKNKKGTRHYLINYHASTKGDLGDCIAAVSDEVKVDGKRRLGLIKFTLKSKGRTRYEELRDIQPSEGQDLRGLSPDGRLDTWLDVFDWVQEQQRIREASGFQDWKGPRLSLLLSLSKTELNQLLSIKRLLIRFYGGQDCKSLVDEYVQCRMSLRKARTLEWSVLKLVLKLLQRCCEGYLRSGTSPTSPAERLLCALLNGENIQSKLDHIEKCILVIKDEHDDSTLALNDDFQPPQLPNYKDVLGDDLNINIQRLLGPTESEAALMEVMSEICYYLLTARTPPDTHTYNMLLVRFAELNRKDLVKAVLVSMLESHVRPNEITHVTFLRYSMKLGNSLSFRRYSERMDGHFGGLAVLNFEPAFHSILKDRYVIYNGESDPKPVEKARMNGEVYEVLIVGAMRLLSDQTAMYYYRNMISEGWSPSPKITLAILKGCCDRLDWEGGAAAFEQLRRDTHKNTVMAAYEWMLRLCQCCGREDVFDLILDNGVHCGALPRPMLDLPDDAKHNDIGFLIARARDIQRHERIAKREKMAERNIKRRKATVQREKMVKRDTQPGRTTGQPETVVEMDGQPRQQTVQREKMVTKDLQPRKTIGQLENVVTKDLQPRRTTDQIETVVERDFQPRKTTVQLKNAVKRNPQPREKTEEPKKPVQRIRNRPINENAFFMDNVSEAGDIASMIACAIKIHPRKPSRFTRKAIKRMSYRVDDKGAFLEEDVFDDDDGEDDDYDTRSRTITWTDSGWKAGFTPQNMPGIVSGEARKAEDGKGNKNGGGAGDFPFIANLSKSKAGYVFGPTSHTKLGPHIFPSL